MNRKGDFHPYQLDLLAPGSMHEPFHEVCVQIAQSLVSSRSSFRLKNKVDEDVWVHYSAVGIVTCHEFPISLSLNQGTLLISFFKDESNEIPIFASSSPYSTFPCHNDTSQILDVEMKEDPLLQRNEIW